MNAYQCATCGRTLDDDFNPIMAGGGGVDESGEFYSWNIGKCCHKSPTPEELQKFLQAIFKE